MLYYIGNTQTHFQEDARMDMIRRLEPRDWLIAIAAFVAGAWIF